MSQTINVCFKAHLDTCEDCINVTVPDGLEGEDLDNAITAAVYDWINDYVSIELTYLKYDAPEEINGT